MKSGWPRDLAPPTMPIKVMILGANLLHATSTSLWGNSEPASEREDTYKLAASTPLLPSGNSDARSLVPVSLPLHAWPMTRSSEALKELARRSGVEIEVSRHASAVPRRRSPPVRGCQGRRPRFFTVRRVLAGHLDALYHGVLAGAGL
jgi:hypothetical protein